MRPESTKLEEAPESTRACMTMPPRAGILISRMNETEEVDDKQADAKCTTGLRVLTIHDRRIADEGLIGDRLKSSPLSPKSVTGFPIR
jgi:hypothetical protein